MTTQTKILIVDDDPPTVDLLQQELEHLGHEMVSCSDGQEALQKIVADDSEYGFPGVLVADIRMPRIDGLELMKRTLKHDPALPVILITAYGDITMAVQAMHDGAYDFIEKPIAPERLSDVVRRALEKRSLVMENRELRAALASKFGMDTRIIGNSPSIVELRESIANLADTEASVLILGETGTGKELVARCLHDFGSRAKYRFVPVNCGAIPENIFESELFGNEAGAYTDARLRIGRLEYGHKGTVFFDEIESMPQQLQVKLLRALEERVIERLGSNEQISVNFRVVTATKADLAELIKKRPVSGGPLFFASTLQKFLFRPYETGVRIFLCCFSSSPNGSHHATNVKYQAFRAAISRSSWPTPGRETCVSSETSLREPYSA